MLVRGQFVVFFADGQPAPVATARPRSAGLLELFDLCLEEAFAFDAASVLGLPVSGLLSQYQVFPVEGGDFLTQIRHFLTS